MVDYEPLGFIGVDGSVKVYTYYINRILRYIGSGPSKRALSHLRYGSSAKRGRDGLIARAVREAVAKGQPELLKCMFLEYLVTAREFEKAILWESKSHKHQLLNHFFVKPRIDVDPKEIVGQLDGPMCGWTCHRR